MVTLVILSEGVNYDGHPAMLMKDIAASRSRVLSFVCRGKLTYSQSNIEVKAVSCDEEGFNLTKEIIDPVAEHRPFTNQQLDIVKYHLNCIGISCRII